MSYNIKLQEISINSSVEPYNLGFDCEDFDKMFSEYYNKNILPNKIGTKPTFSEFLDMCWYSEAKEIFCSLFHHLAGARLLFLYQCSECGTTSREFIKDEDCKLCQEIAKENIDLKNDIMYGVL